MYTFEGSLTYYIECDGNIVYWGKAQDTQGSINITRRIKDYLETEMPDFRDFNGVIVHHPKQMRIFYLRDDSETLLETYTALLESTGEWSVSIWGPITKPVNKRADPRQKIFWTTVETTGKTYESNTEGAEYSGETDTGETIVYYFNYETPTSQNVPSSSTTLTISWDTNYDSINWFLYNGNTSELIDYGVTSNSSITVSFSANTSTASTDYYIFEAYNDVSPSSLGSVSWTVSAAETPHSGSTNYYFTPQYTTAYTNGEDIIWYFDTNYRVNVSAEDGITFTTAYSSADFRIAIKEIGNNYVVLSVQHLPETRTGYTAYGVAKDYSNNEVGRIVVINTGVDSDYIDTGITESGYLSVTANAMPGEVVDNDFYFQLGNFVSSSNTVTASISGHIWRDYTLPAMYYSGPNGEVSYEPQVGYTGHPGYVRIPANVGDTIYLKANSLRGERAINVSLNYTTKIMSVIKGNIMSLYYGDDFQGKTSFPPNKENIIDHIFRFENVDASELLLPATDMSGGCYYGMFSYEGNIYGVPNLPATVLSEECYGEMFRGRTFVNCNPPELPATTLAKGCYTAMFAYTNIPYAPELPATTLANACYERMFQGSNITVSPVLPAENIYYGNEYGVGGNYDQMFRDCSGLTKITCYAKTSNSTGIAFHFTEDVAPSGSFYRARGVIWDRGVNGIPSGWNAFDVDV